MLLPEVNNPLRSILRGGSDSRNGLSRFPEKCLVFEPRPSNHAFHRPTVRDGGPTLKRWKHLISLNQLGDRTLVKTSEIKIILFSGAAFAKKEINLKVGGTYATKPRSHGFDNTTVRSSLPVVTGHSGSGGQGNQPRNNDADFIGATTSILERIVDPPESQGPRQVYVSAFRGNLMERLKFLVLCFSSGSLTHKVVPSKSCSNATDRPKEEGTTGHRGMDPCVCSLPTSEGTT